MNYIDAMVDNITGKGLDKYRQFMALVALGMLIGEVG